MNLTSCQADLRRVSVLGFARERTSEKRAGRHEQLLSVRHVVLAVRRLVGQRNVSYGPADGRRGLAAHHTLHGHQVDEGRRAGEVCDACFS